MVRRRRRLGPYRGRLERLQADARVITAARIGYAFGIDPVLVLRSSRWEWHTRVAAVRVIQADQEREEARRKAEEGG